MESTNGMGMQVNGMEWECGWIEWFEYTGE